MENLNKIKNEIQFKLIFGNCFVAPCWKCKKFKLNKKYSGYTSVFVCPIKIKCKKWKKYKKILFKKSIQDYGYWKKLEKTNNLIDNIYNLRNLRWRMHR